MAHAVSLYPLGVGNAFTERLWFSNMLLTVDGRDIFIDVPSYISKMLAENNRIGDRRVTMDHYREILITHMHADHVGGVEELAYLNYFQSNIHPMKLYAPEWLLQDLWSHLRPSMGESVRGDGGQASFDWFFEPVTLADKHDMGGYSIEHRYTKHHPRTIAYLFDFGNFKLGYSSDTGFDPELIAWLDQADVVLHEVRFEPMEVVGGNEGVLHTSISDLLQLPTSFQEKTHLYHYSDAAFDRDPTRPNFEIGKYRLLMQNKLYRLV